MRKGDWKKGGRQTLKSAYPGAKILPWGANSCFKTDPRPGRKVQFEFTDLDVASADSTCQQDYLIVSRFSCMQ
jgi:hypothetical protein